MGKLKELLFFAIRRNLHSDIVAVTTEKDRGRWFGRYVKDNSATHGSTIYGHPDIDGRYPTQEAAEQARKRVSRIKAAFQEKHDSLNKQANELHRQERQAIAEAVKC